MIGIEIEWAPGALSATWQQHIENLLARDVVNRLMAHDATLFVAGTEDPTTRLGWIQANEQAHDVASELATWVPQWLEGAHEVVLCGMGGSSLFAQVLADAYGVAQDAPRFTVLDTTHPDAVQRVIDRVGPSTRCIFASKSGSTVETDLHRRILEPLLTPHQLVAVTDPGSALADHAHTHGWHHVVYGEPTVGGRFSAMTAFGLLPAAVIGADLEQLALSAAAGSQTWCSAITSPERDEAVQLGAFLSAAVQTGRDKMRLVFSPDMAPFGHGWNNLSPSPPGKSEQVLCRCLLLKRILSELLLPMISLLSRSAEKIPFCHAWWGMASRHCILM